MGAFVNEIAPNIPGDVLKLADTIVDYTKFKGQDGQLPVRVVLGSDALAVVKQKCTEQLSLLDEYEDVSRKTDKDDAGSLSHEGTLRLTSMNS